MARQTKAQRTIQENEEQALEFFKAMLGKLPDPRRAEGVRYPLRSVIVISLMAAVCGSDDAEAMEWWGESNAAWLAGFLELPHGPPSQEVFLAVLGALDPEAFSSVFRSWVSLVTLRLNTTGKHIAVDGKTSRRSADMARARPAVHTVSAWMSEAGLVLGQQKTGDKSNEITVIPELLSVLDLRGATVTIDAMGCQTKIAKTITDGGDHYLLAVKQNQPSLYEDIVTTFEEADDERRRACDEAPRPAMDTFEHVDKGHGRIETRTVTLCRDLLRILSAPVEQSAVIGRSRTSSTGSSTWPFAGTKPVIERKTPPRT